MVIISSVLSPAESASRRPRSELAARAIGIAAAGWGLVVALIYAGAGLTLRHYDSKAHLVVARRVIDSITPGWQQVGALWLPLPHLLNLIPVQIDLFYRTGASGVAMCIAAFGLAAYALARLVLQTTGSMAAAACGAAVLIFNPNLLYLQSTPMTEPLLIGLTLLTTALVVEWAMRAGSDPQAAGWAMALTSLTRYEAWPVTAFTLLAGAFVLWRQGRTLVDALRRTAHLALFPAIAIAAFLVNSRITIGEWFVTSGFFVPDNPATGRPWAAAVEVWWGAHQLSGYAIATLGLLSALLSMLLALTDARRAALCLTVAPLAAAALPWYAYLHGHPFRIRYMIPVVAAEALSIGVAAGLMRPRRLAVVVVAACVILDLRPLDRSAPMLLEAQWDNAHSLERQRITEYLSRHYDGEKIMASMGSLAHYMQETSAAGFRLRDFLHEGNGDIWLAALEAPARIAGWILIDEQAEGRDPLAVLARSKPHLLDSFVRVSEGGGVVLYRRRSPP